MRATVTECSIEAAVERSEEVHDTGGASGRRSSVGTEADKVRLQQHLRRKTKLVRHAMAANRTR